MVRQPEEKGGKAAARLKRRHARLRRSTVGFAGVVIGRRADLESDLSSSHHVSADTLGCLQLNAAVSDVVRTNSM